MERGSKFSYTCNRCGLCCRDQVITLSPYDVIRIARAAGMRTRDAIRTYTIRRGSLLKFTDQGTCSALKGARCSIHRRRPLACRLYPLGLQRDARGDQSFVPLEPAVGSLGVYGEDGIVADFLDAQGIGEYLEAIAEYGRLLPLMRARLAVLVDFETVEPREFWRAAVREALAESGFDPNPLIDAFFDADSSHSDDHGCSAMETVAIHTRALESHIRSETRPDVLATAAVMLAVSLGYTPADAGAI
jgi:Fe-S-cluster containining protein